MIKYYLYKAREMLRSQWAARRLGFACAPGKIVGIAAREKFRMRRVIFDFSDRSLFHLGDQLFHLPLFSVLQAAEIPFTVVGSSQLLPWFAAMGFPTEADLPRDLEGMFVVTKNDRLGCIANKGRGRPFGFLGLDYARIPGDEPVADLICRAVVAALQPLIDGSEGRLELLMGRLLQSPLAPPPQQDWPSMSDIGRATKLQLEKSPAGVILVNPFVASSALQAMRRRPILQQWARNLREEGKVLWLCGTQAERGEADPLGVPAHADHRGCWSLHDLLWTLSHPQVEGVLTFDTFILHSATWLGKPVRVVMKDQRKAALFQKRFVPMSAAYRSLVMEVR